MLGAGGGTSSYAEVEDTDLIVLWGSNARETHPIFFHHVLAGVRNGARLIVVDPRRTASARFADAWLGLEVGTDIALANTVPGSSERSSGSGAILSLPSPGARQMIVHCSARAWSRS